MFAKKAISLHLNHFNLQVTTMNTIAHKKLLQITAQSEHKNLFRAVLKQGEFDYQNLQDIYSHGIDGGFHGFIYHGDTVKFFNRNRNAILTLCEDYQNQGGWDSIYEFIAGFNCLKNFTQTDIVEALCGRGDYVTHVKNTIALFAAEECARFIVESIEE